MEYQYEEYKVIDTYTTTTTNTTSDGSPTHKVSEIHTFDGSTAKSKTEIEVYKYHGVPVFNPVMNMPYGGYARAKYTQLPLRLIDFTKEHLQTDLVDILAANTGCLILILKTPNRTASEPEFMVLQRWGICQSNGAIHWRNKPVSPWFAERQLQTDDYLLARKFTDLARVSKLFDLVVGMLDRRDYSLVDIIRIDTRL